MEPSTKNETATNGGSEQQNLLTKSQVQGLSDHLFNLMHVSDQGAVRKVGSSDARRAYFPKAKIDELFKANPDSDGLYVYFGAHNSTIHPLPPEKKHYENKLTAMLVTAKGTTTNLLDATTASGGSMALGPTKTCPPDICP
jgi:hypothetical protein